MNNLHIGCLLPSKKGHEKSVQRVKKVILNHFLGKRTLSQNCSFVNLASLFGEQILVFMPFSSPDQAWISLPKELEKIGGVFILRGLPDSNFRSFKAQAVTASVQLNPKRLLEYEINQILNVALVEEK